MKPVYEAYQGDLYEIYVDIIGDIQRVLVYRDRQGAGRPLPLDEIPPVVLNRLEEKVLKKLSKRL